MSILQVRMVVVISLAAIVAGVLTACCSSVTGKPPLIDKLVASNMYIYPLDITTVTCLNSTNTTEKLTYAWSCDDGSFEGDPKSVITWRAPNKYGKFHIMVVVDNGMGIINTDSITIEVVAKAVNPQCCTYCK